MLKIGDKVCTVGEPKVSFGTLKSGLRGVVTELDTNNFTHIEGYGVRVMFDNGSLTEPIWFMNRELVFVE